MSRHFGTEVGLVKFPCHRHVSLAHAVAAQGQLNGMPTGNLPGKGFNATSHVLPLVKLQRSGDDSKQQ
jgi:hypothetical protein